MRARVFARRAARGLSLIEVLVSLLILPLALAGVVSAHIIGQRSMGMSKRQAEATALAQDLAAVLQTIPYTSTGSAPNGLFANTSTANDTDVSDDAGRIDAHGAADPVGATIADHQESEMVAGLRASLAPIPPDSIPYQRYWNVSPIPDPLGTTNVAGVTIAAIVRWPREGGGYQHVSVLTTRFDPTQLRQ